MEKPTVTRIVFQQYRAPISYSEAEAANACCLSIQALHLLQASGLIEGGEPNQERSYSEEDVFQLRRIRRLQQELGINLAGVEVILHLLQRLESVHKELDEERSRALISASARGLLSGD
ncbi:chaperone modulator CbpM [Ktedonospora formicarum]|uniref:HTH merR-type domain-containing protein n=1 Tax=Ktedonospora formicarum TaxID=2778364 RepID=A0A8J3HWY2_9CHLR|nr:chaperone modulator CbpM [Ktedonospora formicarum]GHO42383.1 hypothetical protein KSX_05460 [Ktedonospora formicarum]